ncbi:MAG: o-succinylbenzoate synthase [Gilvibacter sp.]
MQLLAHYYKHNLEFKRPSGTSRGVLHNKATYFLRLQDGDSWGIGECAVLAGLSVDDRPDYEQKLQWACDNIQSGLATLLAALEEFPSIQFGLEMAFASLAASNPFVLIPSAFTTEQSPIAINGLIWMGDTAFMKKQIEEKIAQGFDCIKMKIGAIDFDQELEILKAIRAEYSPQDIELRVDANGAFSPEMALEKLKRLSEFNLHSIEQPIAVKQWEQMAALCEASPLPIALDEELIGITQASERQSMLAQIDPAYIILKPSLIGGFAGTDAWIAAAQEKSIKWWITSALESNIGLNAICQYTFAKNSNLPQGLGTGSLYTNNIESPLVVANGTIYYKQGVDWNLDVIDILKRN